MATNRGFSTNLGLPAQPLTQNAELWTELLRIYNGMRALAFNLDTYTGAQGEPADVFSELGITRCLIGLNSRIYIEAGEAIAPGETVGLNGAGLAFRADDGVYFAIGFCTNDASVAIGEFVEIQQLGIFPVGGLTPGSKYYQSTTPGLITAGVTSQCVGYAINSTTLYFSPQF